MRSLSLAVALAAPGFAQPPTPDQQAEVAINAAKKAFAANDRPQAAALFKQFTAKFPNDRRMTDARYGLAVCLSTQPEPDLNEAVKLLNDAAADGGHPDRGNILESLASLYRYQAAAEKEKPKADGKWNDAVRRFAEARDWFGGKRDAAAAGRCRAEQADAELRTGRVKDARRTAEPFALDPLFVKNPAKPLGLYAHGLACFLDRDYNAAGKSLNQLAPFTDPAFGPHAKYLVGRLLHLGGETAEAGTHYDGCLADAAAQKKAAVELLKNADALKYKPQEKARLSAVATGPPPEYAAGATFHLGCLLYEAGKFADALPRFQAFAKEYPESALKPDAELRVGLCFVQLKQFAEAEKVLAPLGEKNPPLADQAFYWLGRAQAGAADSDAKWKAAADTLRKAADTAAKVPIDVDPEARHRRGECLLELADVLTRTKQDDLAARAVQQVWTEHLYPDRRGDEVLNRLAAAVARAGDANRSDQLCDEFKHKYPQSILLPWVLLRAADNAMGRAAEFKGDAAQRDERKRRFEFAAGKYKAVADAYPEFEKVSFARYGLGVCLAQLGEVEPAVKVLEAIPAPDRAGELAPAAFLLADCLIRLAPEKADDALQENIVREKLTAASGLLENYVASNPKAADAPDALLKLGLCLKRLGSTLADANERNTLLNKAREFFEKLPKDYAASPQAAHARLEVAKCKALQGDRGGAMNDLRQFAGPLNASPVAALGLIQLATMLREENKPADAAQVLADARAKHEQGLLQDKLRAEWAHLLKYHHGVALLEAGKPGDAEKLFEEVVNGAGKSAVGAEAALRSGQAKVLAGKKQVEDGLQKWHAAKPEQKNAARQTIDAGRQTVWQAATRLEQRCNDYHQNPALNDARARMLYDAAWACRFLMDEEVQRATDDVRKHLAEKRAADAAKMLPPGATLPPLPPPTVPRSAVPVQDGEKRATFFYKRLVDEFGDLSLSVDARLELAELLAGRGDPGAAVKLLREAIDKEPSDKPAAADLIERCRLKLGECLGAANDWKAAAGPFDVVSQNEKSPYRPLAAYRAGDAYYRSGQFEKAAAKLTPFRDRGEWHNVGGISDPAVLRLGQALLELKQYDPARQAFEVIPQRYGQSPVLGDAKYGVGRVLQSQGKLDEAIAAFDAVAKLTATEVAAQAQVQLGLCKLAQKKPAEAAAVLLAVPYTYPFAETNYAAALEAARALNEAGQPAQAQAVLKKLLADAPKDSAWAKAAAERLK